MPTHITTLLLLGCGVIVFLFVLNKGAFKRGIVNQEFSNLLADLSHVCLARNSEEIAAIITESKELLKHGEEGVAFENLCENLYEWEFPLSQSDYDRLERLGRHYGFDSAKWNFLKRIILTSSSHE